MHVSALLALFISTEAINKKLPSCSEM